MIFKFGSGGRNGLKGFLSLYLGSRFGVLCCRAAAQRIENYYQLGVWGGGEGDLDVILSDDFGDAIGEEEMVAFYV